MKILNNINIYKRYNNMILILDISLFCIFCLLLVSNFNNLGLENYIFIFSGTLFLLVDFPNRVKYLNMLNELNFLVHNHSTVELKKFKNYLIYKYVFNIMKSRNNKYLSSDEIKDFIVFLGSYFILIKSKNNDFYNKKEYYKLIKEILNNKKRWRFSKELNDISIYNIRINDKLFLTHFLKYKYSNKEAEKEILFLLKDKNINEEFLKKEGVSEEYINYCLKRIDN